MRLREKYPKFANFLGAWFPDADLEGLDDKDVIANFLQTPNLDEHNVVRAELKKLLNESELLPYDDISQEANRYFESEDECRAWLLMLNNEFDSST